MTSRVLLLLVLILVTNQCFSQKVLTASDTYPNGQLKFEGKFIVCSVQDKIYPMIETFEKRKFGKWMALNPNGTIKEIRRYTKNVKNCNTTILRIGKWEYFNQDGVLYLTKHYKNDTLFFSDIEVYENDVLLGKSKNMGLAFNQLDFAIDSNNNNLIRNASFEQYFYKPILIENDGKDQIEKLIPFWYSPDLATPDYYNQYRTVNGIPNQLSSIDQNSFIGLMLYLNPTKNRVDQNINYPYINKFTYSENLQTKLKEVLLKNETYCFKASILLSKLSGYQIDKFGVLLTKEPSYFKYSEQPTNPTISFSIKNTEGWEYLCKPFTANGEEAYITLGRLSDLGNTQITKKQPSQRSSLDVNNSAYYLLDNILLYKINSKNTCGCNVADPIAPSQKEVIPFNDFDTEKELTQSRFVLNRILFDVNKAEIKASFKPELQKLFNYLEINDSIKVKVNGYTDNMGTEEHNEQLSLNRAKAISQWLINKGINSERISCAGYGSKQPIAKNTSTENRKLNRRIEIEFFE